MASEKTKSNLFFTCFSTADFQPTDVYCTILSLLISGEFLLSLEYRKILRYYAKDDIFFRNSKKPSIQNIDKHDILFATLLI